MLSDRDYYREEPQWKRQGYWNRHSAVFHLIVINVAVYLLGKIGQDNQLVAWGALFTEGQSLWQVWRLVTYQFLHAGFTHLLFNMYSLWLFGRMVEAALGKRRFVTLYLVSGVLGGALFFLANWNSGAVCVGASGACFGVMVAAAMAFPHSRFMLLLPPIPMKLWVMVVIYCGLEIYYQLVGMNNGIAHLAHLGGALGGFLYMRRLGVRAYVPQWLRRLFGGDSRPRWQAPPRPSSRPPEAWKQSEPFEYSQDELNRILDKMSRQGYSQLTEQEKWTLRQSAEELKRRRES